MIKMSSLIEKTADAKAAEAKAKIQNGYKTVAKILNDDLQGAEFLPGGLLSVKVAAVVGDEFATALKGIGNDTLRLSGISIWRATTSRGTIYVEGLNPSTVDEQWNELIDELKDRSEMI